MNPTQDDLAYVISVAHSLESQGYFEKARKGDQKACSLFAKLTAYTANPEGDEDGYGWLSKSPGETQVDGYAEDAVCFTNDASSLQNAVDLINGAGASGASIGGAIKQRRESNKWVKPQALSPADLGYLLSGGLPHPPQPPTPTPVVPGREEALDEMNYLDAYYKSPEGLQRENGLSLAGKPDFLGIAAWYLDVYQQARIHGKTREEARAAYVSDIRHSDEWKQKHPGETP